jgi:hypothetical protein
MGDALRVGEAGLFAAEEFPPEAHPIPGRIFKNLTDRTAQPPSQIIDGLQCAFCRRPVNIDIVSVGQVLEAF